MANLNKVLLIGNLTRDPDLRYTPGGAAVCEVGLAVNRRFVTAAKEEREEVCFIDIEVWGKQAESVSRFTRKGAQLFVEGRLRLDQWEDRESGKKRSKLRVVAERTQFLGGRGGEDAHGPRGGEEFPAEPPTGGDDFAPPPEARRPAPRSAAPPPARDPGHRAPAPESRASSPPPSLPPPMENPFSGDGDEDAVDNIPF